MRWGFRRLEVAGRFRRWRERCAVARSGKDLALTYVCVYILYMYLHTYMYMHIHIYICIHICFLLPPQLDNTPSPLLQQLCMLHACVCFKPEGDCLPE